MRRLADHRLGIAALSAVVVLSLSAHSKAAEPAPGKGAPETGSDAKKIVEAFRSRCETLIQDRNYTSRETPGYIIETDDPRIEVKEPAALLESFREWFKSYWSGRTDLRPADEKTFVFLFYSYYKYKQLLDEASVAGEIRPVGHYMGGYDVVAVHTDTVGAGDLPDVLIHEATHQLMKTLVYGPDAEPSPWVGEGIASYFGFMRRDKSGKYEASKIGGKEGVVFFPNASRISARSGSQTLDDYRRRIKRGEAGDLAGIIAIRDAAEFYAGDPLDNYAASWLLVHFLLNGDGGAHAAGFATYLRHEVEGNGTPAVFYADVGMTEPTLQAAFNEYVKKL